MQYPSEAKLPSNQSPSQLVSSYGPPPEAAPCSFVADSRVILIRIPDSAAILLICSNTQVMGLS
eukprot:3826696-Ditylum_brightwellii.AAC.1